MREAEGWLERYRDFKGDSDPVTLRLFSEVGELHLLTGYFLKTHLRQEYIPMISQFVPIDLMQRDIKRAIDKGIFYLTKYGKSSFLNYMKMLHSFEK